MFSNPKTRDLSPQTVADELKAHRILLIDVREPAEFAVERIHGALNLPLSTFDPAMLPEAGDKLIVFSCAGGKRSAMAVERCQKAGHKIDAHLAGGIMAWKAQGLPTSAIDAGTGAMNDRA
jgi:rhodanese-related sulfurtransferase